jgi:hypothetical protein
MGSLVVGIMVLMFFLVALATFYYINQVLGNDDVKVEVGTAISKIAICNTILVAILSVVSYMYIRNNPLVLSNYTLIMIHISLLFSITGVSIAMIEKSS